MLDLDHLGLDFAAVGGGVMSPPTGKNMILGYDGDGACYQHSAGVAKLDTAFRRLEKDILTMMFLTGCDSARVHLTPKGCYKNGRHLLLGAKKYQDNRGSAKKPVLLEPLRDGAASYFEGHDCIQIIPNYQLEADDGLIIDAYNIPNYVIVSPDKDLNLNPFKDYKVADGKHRCLQTGDTFGFLDWKEWLTPTGKKSTKVCGKGIKFFLAQLLMGDTADNVKGILKLNGQLCGAAKAFQYLDPITCQHEAVNAVIDAYRVIDQNIIPEAEAMWLLRSEDDNSFKLFNEYELTTENKDFLVDCYTNRKWCLTQEEYDETIKED